jgi:hypothetical protein
VQGIVRGSEGGLIEEPENSSWNHERQETDENRTSFRSYTTRTEEPSGLTLSVTAVGRDNPGRTAMLHDGQCRCHSEVENFDEFSKSLSIDVQSVAQAEGRP